MCETRPTHEADAATNLRLTGVSGLDVAKLGFGRTPAVTRHTREHVLDGAPARDCWTRDADDARLLAAAVRLLAAIRWRRGCCWRTMRILRVTLEAFVRPRDCSQRDCWQEMLAARLLAKTCWRRDAGGEAAAPSARHWR